MGSFLRYGGRFLRRFLGILFVVLLLMVAAISYLGFTASGNQFLANRIAGQISTPDMQVSLEGAKGLLEGRFHLDRVTLSDTRGKFAEIDGLDVLWTPSELFSMRFHANRIAAAKVTFARMPVRTMEREPSDSPFSLPVEVKIDSIDMPLIALGMAVAGQEATLTLNGSAEAVSDRVTLALTASQKDRPGAIAKASLAYAVNARTLTLDGSVSEPRGGLLAGLLKLPGAPPVEIAVKGDGPLHDWKGAVTGRVDNAEVLTLSGSHRLTEPGMHQITLHGGGQLAELMPPALRSLFAGQTKIDIDTRLGENGLVEINAGSIANDSVTIDASGALDPNGDARLVASLQPAGQTVHFELPLASGPISTDIARADLSISGPFRAARIDIDARLDDLATPDAKAQAIEVSGRSDKFNLADRTGSIAFDLDAATVVLTNANAAKLIQGPVRLKGRAEIAPDAITVSDGEIESARLGGRLSARFTPAEKAVAGNFNLFLLPQGLLAPDIESKIQGMLGLSGQLTATLPSSFAVRNLKLSSNLFSAVGSASLEAGAIKANLEGDVADIGAFEDKASGKAHIILEASGPLERPTVSAHVVTPELRLADTTLQDLDVTFDGAIDPKRPGGKLSATISVNGQVINARADMISDDGLISLPSLAADIGANTLAGAINLDARFMPTGRLQFDFQDLASLSALAGQKVEGALKGTADITSADGRITATLTASGPRISSAGAEIVNPKIDVAIANLLGQQLSATIMADRIVSGANHIDHIVLDAGLAGQRTDFDLKSQFDGAPLLASGQLNPSDGWLTLTSFSASPRKIPLKLAEPADIRIKDGSVTLKDLTIAAGDGSIVANGTAGKTLDLTADIRALPVSLANRLSKDLDAAGTISGTVTITGEAATPNVDFNADIQALATRQTRDAGVPPLLLSASGRFLNNQLSLSIERNAADLRAPLLKAEVRLDNGAVSIPSFRLDFGQNTASGALTFDPQFLPSGKINFDLADIAGLAAFAGKTAEGAVKGTVDLASNAGRIDAKVDATGAIRGQAIKAAVEAISENGLVSVPSLKAEIGNNTLSGALTLDQKFMPSGRIAFDFPDISPLAAMAGQKAEGAVKGIADIASDAGRIDAKVSASGLIRGQAIDLQAEAVSDSGAVSVPSLKATIGTNTLSGALSLDRGFLPTGQFSFDLPDIGLLASLAGQKAEGALKGSAALQSTDGRISGTISATGEMLGSSGARIVKPVIDLRFADLLAGQLSGSIAAGQIVSGANHLDQIALKFDLVDSHTRFDLSGQLDAAPLLAQGAIEQRDQGLALTLSSFSATPRKISLKLAQPTEIDIKNGVATLSGLTISAGEGSITVNGSAGRTLDLTAKITALPLALANAFSPGLDAAGAISADITVSGEAAAPEIAFETSLADIATSQTRKAGLPPLAIAAKGRFADNSLSLDATSSLRDQPVTASLAAKLENGTVSLPSLKLDIGKSSFSGALVLDQKFLPSGRIAFTIPDAGALAALLGQKAEGALDGVADIKTEGERIATHLSATGRLRDQAIKLESDVTAENGAVSVPALELAIGSNRLTGGLTLDPQLQPYGKFSFDFPDVALLAALAGQKAEGAVKGTGDITTAAGRIDAKVNATGRIRGQAIDIRTEAISENGAISLPTLKLDVGSNTLSGALTLDKQFMPTGKVTFDLPDIALLAAFAGQKAEGALKGAADLVTDAGKISGTISATGTRIVASGAQIVNPKVDLKIADLTIGQVSGKVTADSIASGANRLTGLALDLDHAGSKTQFDLKSQYDGAPLVARGAIAQTADGVVVSLSSFSAAPRKIPVKLDKPTEIRIDKGVVALNDLAISAGRGSIRVTGSAGNRLDLTARITALPASLANAFASGLDAAGTISANVTAKGSTAAPVIAFDTTWQNAAISQTRTAGLSNFTIKAKGQLERNVLSINANARSGDGLSLNADGTLGLSGNRTLGIKVNGKLPFAALAGQLAERGVDLKGTADFNVNVAGSVANPLVTGRITTSGATLTVIRQNLTVKSLGATIDLDGRQARITSLKGTLAGGGTIDVSGTIGIAPNSGFPADLKIALKNAVYTDGKVVAAKLSGDLAINGSLTASPVLSGRIRLPRADITIPEKLPGTLAQLDVKHKNAPRQVIVQSQEIKKNLPTNRNDKGSGGMALDLKISGPRQIFVRGRGLDAELGGDVSIKGTSNAPIVSGGFKMLRGRLSIIGRRLDFTAGTISFGGGMMPALDLVASSTVNATTINVTVSGLTSNPTVAFSSSPALPQDEVLALLIFGRNSASLSPVQIAQLADAVSTLAGGSSNSLFNKLRQGLGVDDLDVGTDENGKSNVSAGKYLNKRTYIQLQQGIDDSTSKAVINLDIGKGLKLRTEAGTDGSAATGLFYEKEY